MNCSYNGLNGHGRKQVDANPLCCQVDSTTTLDDSEDIRSLDDPLANPFWVQNGLNWLKPYTLHRETTKHRLSSTNRRPVDRASSLKSEWMESTRLQGLCKPQEISAFYQVAFAARLVKRGMCFGFPLRGVELGVGLLSGGDKIMFATDA